MKTVSDNLEPGTARNITLKAQYTRIEAPYRAKLKSYYADSNETKTRDIEATVSEFLFVLLLFAAQIEMGSYEYVNGFGLLTQTFRNNGYDLIHFNTYFNSIYTKMQRKTF